MCSKFVEFVRNVLCCDFVATWLYLHIFKQWRSGVGAGMVVIVKVALATEHPPDHYEKVEWNFKNWLLKDNYGFASIKDFHISWLRHSQLSARYCFRSAHATLAYEPRQPNHRLRRWIICKLFQILYSLKVKSMTLLVSGHCEPHSLPWANEAHKCSVSHGVIHRP